MIKRLLLGAIACAAASCGGNDNIVEDAGPEALYDRGSEMMEAGNYQGAVQYFLQLEARYPFSNLTRQAQLDIISAYYKSRQPEAAIDAADEFIRENPTHPRVDYALYMKGLVYFDEGPNVLERLFKVDMSARPPKDTEEAFNVFQELLRRFPDSRYAADAHRRMVFLRNRLAEYENHVARWYIRRGAYVAAVQRAEYAIEHYPGAPQLEESLEIMIEAYNELGMTELAADARRVLERSFGDGATPSEPIRLD
ncbi:MAG TPA: outer membrane protein assembly factor BamD [Gammaproteobacteria bacterium]